MSVWRLLVEEFFYGFGNRAAFSASSESFGGDSHHFAHFAGSGGAGFGYDGFQLIVEFLGRKLLG